MRKDIFLKTRYRGRVINKLVTKTRGVRIRMQSMPLQKRVITTGRRKSEIAEEIEKERSVRTIFFRIGILMFRLMLG